MFEILFDVGHMLHGGEMWDTTYGGYCQYLFYKAFSIISNIPTGIQIIINSAIYVSSRVMFIVDGLNAIGKLYLEYCLLM